MRRGLRGVLDDLIHMLRPVVFHLLEIDLLQLIAASEIDGSVGAIEALLQPHEAGLPDGLTVEVPHRPKRAMSQR